MTAARPSTVRQLLASPLLEGATLLGGEAGLDRVVSDVVLSSKVTRDSTVPQGSFVVLDATSSGAHPYLIDHAVRVLAEADGAGLLIADPSARPDLGPARLANQFRLPLVMLEGRPAVELAFALRAAYWAPDAEQLAAVSRLVTEFGLMKIRDVDTVLERLRNLCGFDVAMIDRNRHVVAGPWIEAGGRRLADNVDHHVDHRGDDALHSVPITLAPGEPISYWLVSSSRAPDAAQRVVRTVLHLGGWYVTALLASTRMRHEREARRRIAVLNDLLESGERPERDLRQQLVGMGWTVSGWNMGIHIKVGDMADPGRIVDMYAEVRQQLDEVGLRGPVVERTDGWTSWVTFDDEPLAAAYVDVTAAVAAALARLVAAHPGLTAHGGVGRPSPDVAGLRRSLAEGQEAALICVAKSHDPSGATHIDQLGVQRVLVGWFGSEEFRSFAGAMLAPLVAVDRDQSLLKTLEAYLDAAGSSSMAAARLEVHRNTVSNRIQRVEQLLGVDLTDAEVRLSLQLACRMTRLRG